MSTVEVLECIKPFVPFVLSFILAMVAIIGWRRHRETGFFVLAVWALLMVGNELILRFGFRAGSDFLNQKIGRNETNALFTFIFFTQELIYHGGLLAAAALLVFRRKQSK
jgi:biotin transporter BioY